MKTVLSILVSLSAVVAVFGNSLYFDLQCDSGTLESGAGLYTEAGCEGTRASLDGYDLDECHELTAETGFEITCDGDTPTIKFYGDQFCAKEELEYSHTGEGCNEVTDNAGFLEPNAMLMFILTAVSATMRM